MAKRIATLLAVLITLASASAHAQRKVGQRAKANAKITSQRYFRDRHQRQTGGRVGEVSVARQVGGETVHRQYLVTNRGLQLFRRGGVAATPPAALPPP